MNDLPVIGYPMLCAKNSGIARGQILLVARRKCMAKIRWLIRDTLIFSSQVSELTAIELISCDRDL